MKRIPGLHIIILTLFLIVQLTGSASAGGNAERQLDFPESGGWPPEIIGAWVGLNEDLWGQFTFQPNGKYDLMVFESSSLDKSGTYETFEKADKISIAGDALRLTLRGITSIFRRVPGPYIRLKAEAEAVSPSVNSLLAGTYGGRMGGTYIEWTFHGDGRFTQITPYEALQESGYYIAGSTELAFLLNGKITVCTYTAGQDTLVLDLPEPARKIMFRKTGPLAQFPSP